MITNIVLEGLKRISDGGVADRNILAGEARFVRAYALFYLSQIFCPPYDADKGHALLGLPLRTSSDFSERFGRSTLADTYTFIIDELNKSVELLPDLSQFKSRASKPAALAILARIYLIMGKYELASEYAIKALSYNDRLLDYNKLDRTLRIPFEIAHEEIIYYGFCNSGYLIANSRAFIPKSLYESYAENDLRKSIFYTLSSSGDIQFKGSYDGVGGTYFAGIATDELYLILAESKIRTGQVEGGLEVLNNLLITRYQADSFIPYGDLNLDQALDLVLMERRKELIKRGLRWTDLRRLLLEPRRVEILYRKSDNGVDNNIYSLEPNANNYVYPIPPNVMRLGEYEQNPL